MSVQSQIEFTSSASSDTLEARQAAAAADQEIMTGTLGQNEAETEEKKESWWSSFSKNVASLGTTVLSLRNQKKQLDINLKRAQVGQPPIDVAGAPVLTTQVQLPPETVNKITASAGMQMNKILIFGALALGAFMLMRR